MLLAELGDPQLAYPAMHVVGTNGKSTTTRMTEALLSDAGLTVGAYISPHVRGWSERIRIGNAEADFERALEWGQAPGRGSRGHAVRSPDRCGPARVRGLPASTSPSSRPGSAAGTTRRTSCGSRVVVLTNVALDHMEVLGDTREAIAAEKLAVVQPGATVVLSRARVAGARRAERRREGRPDLAEQPRARDRGRRGVPRRLGRRRVGGGRHAARPARATRASSPLEIWDGAHNLAGVAYLLPRLPERDYVLVSSILADKRPDLMLEALSVLGRVAGRYAVVEYPLAARRGTRYPRRTVLRPCRDRRRSGRGTAPRTGPGGPRRRRPRLGLPLSS